jgi:gliding motility-associated-like protein
MEKIICFLLCCLAGYPVLAEGTGSDPSPKGSLSLAITSTGTECGKPIGTIIAVASGGTGPYMYSENGNPPQSSGNFLRLPAGLYVVTVTDAVGATTSSSVTLINTFNPPTGVSSLITLPTGCASTDASITLAGLGGTPPYQYSLDETNYQTSNYFPNLTAGIYYCMVKDINGCLSPDQILDPVTIKEVCPIIQEGIGLSYTCFPFSGELVLFNVTGGTAPYAYSLDGMTYQASNLFNNLPAGLYKEWVKDATGTILLYTSAVVDRCPISFSVTADAQPSDCGLDDGTVTITPANGIGPYLYTIDGINYQSNNQFSGLAPGTYTVKASDGEPLTSSVTFVIGNNCLTVTGVAVSTTCGNSDGSILATGANGTTPYQYSLNGFPFQTSNSFTGLSAGMYTVAVQDANGFTNEVSVTVGNTAGPAITNATSTPASCTVADGTVLLTTLGGTQPFQYSLGGILFQDQPTFTGVASGSFHAVVKDANGCIDSTQGVVGVNNTLTADAGEDPSLCEGSNTPLLAQSNGTSFSWQPTTNLSDPLSLDPVASPPVTTQYYLTAVAGVCSAVDSVTVLVLPAPVPDAGEDVTLCFGKSTQLNGSGGISYSWSPSTYLNNTTLSDPLVIQPSGTITYGLSVTDANHCSSLQDDFVTVFITPPAEVFAGNDTSITIGQPLPLHAIDVQNSGFTQYTWSPTTGLNNPSIQDPVAMLSNSIVYTVTAVTPAGCEGMDTISIKVFERADIFVPSAFTPNGDGHNDILKAIPVGIHVFNFFIVYNRWGQEVFRTSDPQRGWDGVINGAPQRTATFVWMAAGIDFEGHLIQRKGTVLLIK